MEACHINLEVQGIETLSSALISIKYRRELLNHQLKKIEYASYLERTSNIFVSSNLEKISFEVINKDGTKEYKFTIGKNIVSVNVNDFTIQAKFTDNINFMSSIGANDANLIKRYSSLQKNDKEKYLNDFLKKVDSRIESFKVIEDIPQCKVNSRYIEITDMGEGVRHLISIISSLYSSENGQLFIDEIDCGVHYTILDDIWELIFKLYKELNIQVFATTHSKECIESFNRKQIEFDDKESSYFELAKKINTDKIFMSPLSSSQLEYELSHQGKYRGE